MCAGATVAATKTRTKTTEQFFKTIEILAIAIVKLLLISVTVKALST